jgi:hypothetical protein
MAVAVYGDGCDLRTPSKPSRASCHFGSPLQRWLVGSLRALPSLEAAYIKIYL